MKCTNKQKMARFAALLLSAALSGMLVSGCGSAGKLDNSYDTYNTTAAYDMVSSPLTGSDTSFFAEDLCVGGTENTQTESFAYDSTAEAEAVFNLQTHEIKYAKNIYEQVYPASTTKILTAYIALKYGNLDDVVTVSSTAAAVPYESSVAGLKTGDQLTLRDLLYGLLLMSGNDAANAIAEYISGSTSDFAALMNEEAQKLGATHSHFVNPHGYPEDDHYTTLYDLYLIFDEAIKIPEFEEIIETAEQTVTYKDASGQEVTQKWENSDWYLCGLADAPSNITILGGKTGSSTDSGYCLVLYSKNASGQPIISIVMKCDSKENLYPLMSELLVKFS